MLIRLHLQNSLSLSLVCHLETGLNAVFKHIQVQPCASLCLCNTHTHMHTCILMITVDVTCWIIVLLDFKRGQPVGEPTAGLSHVIFSLYLTDTQKCTLHLNGDTGHLLPLPGSCQHLWADWKLNIWKKHKSNLLENKNTYCLILFVKGKKVPWE